MSSLTTQLILSNFREIRPKYIKWSPTPVASQIVISFAKASPGTNHHKTIRSTQNNGVIWRVRVKSRQKFGVGIASLPFRRRLTFRGKTPSLTVRGTATLKNLDRGPMSWSSSLTVGGTAARKNLDQSPLSQSSSLAVEGTATLKNWTGVRWAETQIERLKAATLGNWTKSSKARSQQKDENKIKKKKKKKK